MMIRKTKKQKPPKKNSLEAFAIKKYKDNLTKEQLISEISKEYDIFKRKFIKLRTIFIVINCIIFLISALLIILNLFAIRNNGVPTSVPLFIAIAFTTGFIAFFTSISSFFEFKNKQKKYNTKVKTISDDYNYFSDQYKKNKNLDENIVKLFDNLTNDEK